jgi:hypothetical protein
MLAACGGYGCYRIFQVKGKGVPAVYICPECEEKMNKGIKLFLHTNIEKVNGNFNILEKLNGTVRL